MRLWLGSAHMVQGWVVVLFPQQQQEIMPRSDPKCSFISPCTMASSSCNPPFSRPTLNTHVVARQVFAQNLSALSGRAIFLRHSGFLGALGSLRRCLSHRVGSPAAGVAGRGGGGGAAGGGGSGSGSYAALTPGCQLDRDLDPRCYPVDLGLLGRRCSVQAALQRSATPLLRGTHVRLVTCPTHRLEHRAEAEAAVVAMSAAAVGESHGGAGPGAGTGTDPGVSGDGGGDSVCDANLWWQCGMLWAYAASFASLAAQLAAPPLRPSSRRPLGRRHGGGRDGGGSRGRGRELGAGAASKAMGSAEAEAASGGGVLGDWRAGEALRCLERCCELEPRCALGFWAMAWVHGHRPLPREEEEEQEQEQEEEEEEEEEQEEDIADDGVGDSFDIVDDEEEEAPLPSIPPPPFSSSSSPLSSSPSPLSFESAHFAGRRAVALLRADPRGFTKAEAALVEATALRFALWPPR